MIGVVRTSWTFDGQAWVTYDHLFRRQAAANRSLDWATEDQAIYMYNKGFAGRAKATTRCKHCLSDALVHDQCPDIPWTSMVWSFMPSQALLGRHPTPTGGDKETCHRFNEERCFVQRCKYRHVCSLCLVGHPATRCSKHHPLMGQGSHHPYLRNPKESPAS